MTLALGPFEGIVDPTTMLTSLRLGALRPQLEGFLCPWLAWRGSVDLRRSAECNAEGEQRVAPLAGESRRSGERPSGVAADRRLRVRQAQ